ncbi:hypothetical protein Pyn_13436 [Prunus yedoensis var. nudiflora]|uniref:Uncharacterized protein n=1 Tax=Prunus yedoensis var. nudiflora TaxID=2094558 RepID=A0A314ZP03_PRUYE|nr:hypothetical protein Pyn_13436 [Prunus yedoensis var. nudiflora]
MGSDRKSEEKKKSRKRSTSSDSEGTQNLSSLFCFSFLSGWLLRNQAKIEIGKEADEENILLFIAFVVMF